ncbi:hypothetical protein [Polaromonas sp. DSR2-3-2]|uniref:hypothetical protein n=1 Tax=unclassified Polaromonas TaxID=2638319 RepID=UPI003CEFB7A3
MNHSIGHPAEAGRLLIDGTKHGVSQTGIAAEDWNLLFCAVTDRLRQCANDLLAAGSLPQQTPSIILFSSEMLECVDALDQLHVDLRLQRSRLNE